MAFVILAYFHLYFILYFNRVLLVFLITRINVKKIAFGNKEHTTDKKMGSLGFIETLHKQQ